MSARNNTKLFNLFDLLFNFIMYYPIPNGTIQAQKDETMETSTKSYACDLRNPTNSKKLSKQTVMNKRL